MIHLDDLRGDATYNIYGICFLFLQKHICGDCLILNFRNFMLFVLQNPIVFSQKLEKIEQKFQGAYNGF